MTVQLLPVPLPPAVISVPLACHVVLFTGKAADAHVLASAGETPYADGNLAARAAHGDVLVGGARPGGDGDLLIAGTRGWTSRAQGALRAAMTTL